MQATIQKWGNSLALRIPKAVAAQIGVVQGAAVDLAVESGALRVRPAAPRELRLDDLVASITPENRHDETDTGAAVGAESW